MPQQINPAELPKLRTANEINAAAAGSAPPALLFDEFWREGELAMLFGPAGVGKSLLAVGIGEALARGRSCGGLRMPGGVGRGVLYVDLVLSDRQFAMRYSNEKRGGGRRLYKFSNRFYRGRPQPGEDLAAWLREVVESERIRVVIVDDLSLVAQTDDGTRHTLALMHELRRMTHELGISALVLADSHAPAFGRSPSERDLRRMRALCPYADSVFTLATAGSADYRQLVQTRSQGGEIAWTSDDPAEFVLSTTPEGFVGLDFVESELTYHEREQIHRVKTMHDAGHSFRAIADELNISKSTAARLHAKWKPELAITHPASRWIGDRIQAGDKEDTSEPSGLPGTNRDEPADGRAAIEPADRESSSIAATPPDGDQGADTEPDAASPPQPRTVFDLERSLDGYGEEIFVESREHHTERPLVWYKRDRRKDTYTQYSRRGLYGIALKHLDTTGQIPAPEGSDELLALSP